MERHIFAACGALAIAGVTLAGQSTSPSQPPATTPSMASAGSVTVQGCLKPATGSASTGSPSATGTTGTAGSPGAVAGGAQFMLTDAEMKTGAAGSGTTGTTGTTGAPTTGEPTSRSGAMGADEFILSAEGSSVNLSQYVNQQVEVVGRLAPSSSTMTGTTGTTGTGTTATGTTGTGTTGTGTTASRPASAGDRPTLTVTSVKMIAATCK